MGIKKRIAQPTVKSIASYVQKNRLHVRSAQRSHMKMAESVREADYQGHHIVVRTTYRIEVDGRPLTGHLGVTNDGQVHYHPVPNVSFSSAIDLVKQLIDVFPDDFTGKQEGAGDSHEGHMHMMMPKKNKPRRK